MKNLPIVLKKNLNILQASKKGTLILDCNEFEKFGLEERPFNLTAVPVINGHTDELIYEIKAAWKHSFSKGNVTGGNVFYKIL